MLMCQADVCSKFFNLHFIMDHLTASFQLSLDKIEPTLQSNSMETTITKDSRVLLKIVSPESLDGGSASFSDWVPTSVS